MHSRIGYETVWPERTIVPDEDPLESALAELRADACLKRELRLVLDTNVIIEVTTGELWNQLDRSPELSLQLDPRFRSRVLRTRCSAVLARWLAKTSTCVFALGDEFVRKLREIAPAGEPTAASVISKLKTYLCTDVLFGCDHWKAYSFDHLEVSGNRADDFLLAVAREFGVPLITNEGVSERGIGVRRKKSGLREKCARAGVKGIPGCPTSRHPRCVRRVVRAVSAARIRRP